MRLQGLTIYSQYFRFLLEDDRAIAENAPSPFGPMVTAVIYDNERQTVRCACVSNGSPCEHKVFIHEMIDKEEDRALFRFLEDCREESAQTITPETLNRIRGAFAREYNLAKGVVQYPERRQPLGWQGDVPRARAPMRVIQRTSASFMVYEIGSDDWKLIVGISDPECQGDCKEGCKHEQAVALAVRDWRAKGLLPNWTIGEDLSVRGYRDAAAQAMNTGRDDLEKIVRERMEKAAREEVINAFQRTIWDAASGNSTASANTVDIDPAKFKEDINKAKELLEKKEKPKPEKPAKPRTRFTDLEL